MLGPKSIYIPPSPDALPHTRLESPGNTSCTRPPHMFAHTTTNDYSIRSLSCLRAIVCPTRTAPSAHDPFIATSIKEMFKKTGAFVGTGLEKWNVEKVTGQGFSNTFQKKTPTDASRRLLYRVVLQHHSRGRTAPVNPE